MVLHVGHRRQPFYSKTHQVKHGLRGYTAVVGAGRGGGRRANCAHVDFGTADED